MSELPISAQRHRSIKPWDPPLVPNLTTGRTIRFIQCWILTIVGLFGGVPAPLAIAEAPFSEAEVKAVFLYNFANFVSWPQTPGQDLTTPFRYCVLDDEIAPVLQEVLKGETVRGRPLSVQREVTNASSLAECHVLYVGKGRLLGSELWDLVREAPSVHVLTVSDLEGFETRDGMIALVRQDRRIHPRINMDAVERSKLRISAKLLNLATIVRGDTAGK